jgi:hypothetical protein
MRDKSGDFRVMFGVGPEGNAFISPWFKIKDAALGINLVVINVVFTYSGNNIDKVEWDADCMLSSFFSLRLSL